MKIPRNGNWDVVANLVAGGLMLAMFVFLVALTVNRLADRMDARFAEAAAETRTLFMAIQNQITQLSNTIQQNQVNADRGFQRLMEQAIDKRSGIEQLEHSARQVP